MLSTAKGWFLLPASWPTKVFKYPITTKSVGLPWRLGEQHTPFALGFLGYEGCNALLLTSCPLQTIMSPWSINSEEKPPCSPHLHLVPFWCIKACAQRGWLCLLNAGAASGAAEQAAGHQMEPPPKAGPAITEELQAGLWQLHLQPAEAAGLAAAWEGEDGAWAEQHREAGWRVQMQVSSRGRELDRFF